jgi:hypothetical protein
MLANVRGLRETSRNHPISLLVFPFVSFVVQLFASFLDDQAFQSLAQVNGIEIDDESDAKPCDLQVGE